MNATPKLDASWLAAVGNEFDKPYMYITLVGILKSPRLWFDPMAIVLTPVPLETEMTANFQILAANYSR